VNFVDFYLVRRLLGCGFVIGKNTASGSARNGLPRGTRKQTMWIKPAIPQSGEAGATVEAYDDCGSGV
jgi:hypothetical protein